MSSVQFTALIRLPFIRGDFEDPPQAQWDAERDRQLWKVISKSSKTSDLNWVELADKFQVPPTFLLQQAAWLYERHLDHVRNQMKKVSISNAAPSSSPTGGSTLTAVGGVAMRRGGSAGSGASPDIPDSSSSSSSSLSDTDHPAHRSQLFKRPPRFQQKKPRELSTFEEGDGTQEIDDSGSHETSLPFATVKTRPINSKYAQDSRFRASSSKEQKVLQPARARNAPPVRQTSMDVQSIATTETASSMTSSGGPPSAAKSPMSPASDHRAALGRLGSPRRGGLRSRKEGSEGTPSMGSSFSDIDATRYTFGRNDINFPIAYRRIKSLLTHPSCPHRPQYLWPCDDCESAFTTKYWTCAATLLDYFADFHPIDTPLMQSIWFYLLDIWQESAHILPYETVLDETIEHSAALIGVARARDFEKAVRDTITLFEVTIWGRRTEADSWDQVIYDPRGEAMCPVGEYDTGPWVSGVKPWNQFLGEGGMGVAAPWSAAASTPTSQDDTNGDGDGSRNGEQERTTTRYIPHPAIALIEGHTARSRLLANSFYTKQKLTPPQYNAALADWEAHTVVLPSKRSEFHTYTSRFTGRETTYTLSNGAPPIMRYEGLGDPQLELAVPDGDWNLMDECVASCRGVTAYVGVSGGDEDEEDEDMVDSEDELVPFDLWTVVEKAVEGGGRGELLDLGDTGGMFETWWEGE
ncbi:uncharacterized protein J4E87_002877 [Alternaria ethzedia]|uniref:uncharacterized protein n=1 Tax=Alternaria ethzedia TaxID=181014 RepID=UPI0020C25481|nr:uncharacterized protein J4E87_002877 [Alternaria ethzedia]KAI4629691.1 hypothetical protein J4E87_002877 [Alternaria ethzedia]